MKFLFSVLICFTASVSFSQNIKTRGMIAGSLMNDQTSKALVAATIIAKNSSDSNLENKTVITDKEGNFLITNLALGYYSIIISAVSFEPLRIDSIYIRNERLDFNLGDIRLSVAGKSLAAVIVYAEKPLFENKDGKITFNAAESALSAGATTTELLKQTPLITVDNDGKILMRGKEVKVLIDDKPVEMDARQLQDLLESMPGSMIEKIEVLTTPPPQYANERGGVINIVTKKGKVGVNGRLNLNYGSRGEAGGNGNFSYRKNKIALNVSAGFSFNRYRGSSYSTRENIYKDSTNHFKTIGSSNSQNKRPNSRIAVDYDFNKKNSLNFTAFLNANDNDGESITQYSNINRYDELYKLSTRSVGSQFGGINPSGTINFLHKGKTPGEQLRIIAGAAWSRSTNNRQFYQQYLQPDGNFNGSDSTQEQNTRIKNQTLSLSINYDKPLKDKKTQLSFGSTMINSNTQNQLFTSFMKKPENLLIQNDLLSNDFKFYQDVFTSRAALRYLFKKDFFANVGLQQEYAHTSFNIANNPNHFVNSYFSTLPYANITRKWQKGYTLTASYKRSIQRPGIFQLNPSVDYTDPYNTRFGNPYLQPYYSDNFDGISGYWNKKFNINFSVGYNVLQQIYSAIRTLQPDGKTFTSWQNLSGRKEYETSAWGGVNIGKKLKLNSSAGYTYNAYGAHDRKVNRYRSGGSLNATLNGNYQWNTLIIFTGNFTYHRFANPQGTVRNNVSMNLGVQQKFFQKNLSISLNVVDPFRQQQNKNFIQGPNYNLETYSMSNSRNYKIAVGYNFKKKKK